MKSLRCVTAHQCADNFAPRTASNKKTKNARTVRMRVAAAVQLWKSRLEKLSRRTPTSSGPRQLVETRFFPHIFVWGSCFWLCTPACLLLLLLLLLLLPLPLTHNLLTHNLLTHNLPTHNLLAHTDNLLTHNLLTHNLFTRNLLTHIEHTQLAHTQLAHIQLVHTHTHC